MKNQPCIFAIAGLPGAGKTSFRKIAVQNGLLPVHAFVHDCDYVMEAMPEYRADVQSLGAKLAFKNWELPARAMANQQLFEQIHNGCDIIYDRTCALPESLDHFNQFLAAGYKLIMYFVYTDLRQALLRSASREQQIGRHVPESVITERWQMLKNLWPKYLEIATSVYLIDGHSQRNNIFAHYLNQSLTIHDSELYQQFTSNMKIDN